MKKKFLIAVLFLLFFSSYNNENIRNINSNLVIKKVSIENNFLIDEELIKKKLSFLYETNFLFLKTNKIEKKLTELDFVESFVIKKIYPNEVKIKIFEKKPIAIIQNKKKKKYFTNKGNTINYKYFKKFDNLPVVFGDEKDFKIFYKNLKLINFPLGEIKTLYLFETKRWDIVTIKNQTIKLPIFNYNESLKNFINLKDQSNFQKYQTFDYRINNQLILI